MGAISGLGAPFSFPCFFFILFCILFLFLDSYDSKKKDDGDKVVKRWRGIAA